MRFFTRELWDGIQQGGEEATPYHERWDLRVREYWEQYAGIRGHLPEEVREFFDEPRLHDGRLLTLRVSATRRRGGGAPTATMEVAHPEEPSICVLEYSGVRSLNTTTPDGDDLGHGIDDWGYDEISMVEQLLKHEVIFASGLELSIICDRMRITSRTDARDAVLARR